MRSGLVLYRLVFIKNAPVCAGAFFAFSRGGVSEEPRRKIKMAKFLGHGFFAACKRRRPRAKCKP